METRLEYGLGSFRREGRHLLQDARSLRQGAEVRADLCIIGAGAAGITIARALKDRPLDICVLESGGLEPDVATQDLYRGAVVGQPYAELESTRRRFFGGSTNCWHGYCRPLDPGDFQPRAWVPHSGWPFDRSHLDPYYARAHEILRLGPYDYDPSRWEGARSERPRLGPELMQNEVYQFGNGALRMGVEHRSELEAAARTRVLLHANCRRIDLDESGRRVEGVEAQCLGGPGFRVAARHYVLAAGGIENARILLASRNVQEHGIGNQNDLVGRFFMEHPHLRMQGLFLAHTARGLGFYDMRKVGGKLARGILVPRESWLRREKLLNHTVQLWSEPGGTEDEFTRAVAAAAAETDAAGGGLVKRFPLVFHCEQSPNPSSRVMLGDELDPLGVPRVRLDWRLLDIDKRSARRAHELVAQALGLAELGRVRVTLLGDDSEWPESMGGGNHHMGTTRMHVDPKQGVVDERCTVHGVANLLVAGSSVFPTGGAANPTLTIVALALRMADQLKRALS